jgi:hypothetical protein
MGLPPVWVDVALLSFMAPDDARTVNDGTG